MSAAGSMAINGYPMFTSFSGLTMGEARQIVKKVNIIETTLEAL
jgi:hypothetical protein